MLLFCNCLAPKGTNSERTVLQIQNTRLSGKKINPTISRLTPRGKGRGEEERVGGQETCQELEKST